MIQLDSIINMLNDVPDNSTLRLRTIVEGCLITELPNGIQNRLNKINDNCTIPRKARRKTIKENRNTIRNKRSRGAKAKEQKKPKQA